MQCDAIQFAIVCSIEDCDITAQNYNLSFTFIQDMFDEFDGVLELFDLQLEMEFQPSKRPC